jgi:hypothetical protein
MSEYYLIFPDVSQVIAARGIADSAFACAFHICYTFIIRSFLFKVDMIIIIIIIIIMGSWDSVVGIATGYELDDRVGVRVQVGSRFSLLHEA